LTWLSLAGNQISDITPLAALSQMAYLELNGNQLSDISSLASLTNLASHDLNSNQIYDISPLVENVGLGEGDEVWLEGNELDLWLGSEDQNNIQRLQERGVIVHY
jgi:Leucine-rich repeat (LRR) protein